EAARRQSGADALERGVPGAEAGHRGRDGSAGGVDRFRQVPRDRQVLLAHQAHLRADHLVHQSQELQRAARRPEEGARRGVERGVEWACILLLAIITVDLLLGVFSRYVLERTFVWYDEVARACFIWLVFLGAAAAVKRGAHFGLHMFVELMPPPLKRAALLLT